MMFNPQVYTASLKLQQNQDFPQFPFFIYIHKFPAKKFLFLKLFLTLKAMQLVDLSFKLREQILTKLRKNFS